VAKLTDDEANMLKKLMAKREAPESGPVGRAINVSIDLGDDKQVERAMKLGLLDADSLGLGGGDENEGDGEEEADDTPVRPGYFGRKSA
jgi:hypothetical protein